jgi:glycosyltransferase involved in cell wall biosynthesis
LRVAVFNRHWSTLGGGEQLAGGLASALATEHAVDLLVLERFDAAHASERLGFDLTGLEQRVLEPGTRPFLEATEGYDLLVNTSFGSALAHRARLGLYYVHFPVPHPPLMASDRRTWIGERLRSPFTDWTELTSGFWLREHAGGGCWTRDVATMDLALPREVILPFSFRLGASSWPSGRRPRVVVSVAGDVVFDGRVERTVRVSTTVTGRGVSQPLPVRISSDTFIPRLEGQNEDDRELGVVVSHVVLGPRRLPVPGRLIQPFLRDLRPPFVAEFLERYEIAANSRFTAAWVEKLWGRTARVLPPPVQLRTPGLKRAITLSVGRFFPNALGHSKKQLEMVDAFRQLFDRGFNGWELHLVGGCAAEHRRYVEEVRRAAAGLPVLVHVNARGEDLADLFAAARIFWHAAGLGEDPQLHPDRFEHFGISVIEAMSAGAVPVVFGQGGPAELVDAPRAGRVFVDPQSLVQQTQELIAMPDELDRCARAAQRVAAQFGPKPFARHALDLVAELAHQGVHPSA